MQAKPKALVFFTYLPPWRIDVFNAMGAYYDLTIVFLNADAEGFKYDRALLLERLKVPSVFLSKGFNIGTKPFRLGVLRLLKEYNPEVVFSHEFSPTSIWLSAILKLKLLKFNLVITTSDNLEIAHHVGWGRGIARKLVLKAADGLVVYSNEVRDFYSLHFPWLKVEVCPNIQNPTSLNELSELFPDIIQQYRKKYDLQTSNVVLYVGRLTYVKGLDLLIAAFAKLISHNYKLVIVGEGEQKSDLKKQVDTCGLSNQIFFIEQCYGEPLYAWYKLANFLVLPSRFEPFGAVVNEALVFGCPVLVSKNVGAQIFVTPANGLVCDVEDETLFVDALKGMMENYKGTIAERHSLMPVVFEDYVGVFRNFI